MRVGLRTSVETVTRRGSGGGWTVFENPDEGRFAKGTKGRSGSGGRVVEEVV